jgi:hypothetical protein
MKTLYSDCIDDASIQMMDCDSKVGVLATEDESDYPHLSFISSIQALGEHALTFGQFSAGLSKRFILDRPRVGFLVLSADKRYLSGNAVYTHSANTGKEFDLYNNKPLFRYNSYMGFYRMFYLNLERISALKPLPMGAIVLGAILSRAKALFVRKSEKKALPLVGQQLFSQLDSLKFLCYYDETARRRSAPRRAGNERGIGSHRALRHAVWQGAQQDSRKREGLHPLPQPQDGERAGQGAILKGTFWRLSASTTPCRPRWNTSIRAARRIEPVRSF